MFRKNIILVPLVLLLGSMLLSSCISLSSPDTEPTQNNTEQEEVHLEEIQSQEETKNTQPDVVRQRIESIRKRHELRDMLISAESYLEGGQQALGLKTLLDVYRENPEDGIVVTKIAETYFEMKRFGSALNYYMRLPSLSLSQRDRVLLLYFYTEDITTDAGRNTILEALKKLNIAEEDLKYYALSLSCLQDSSKCYERFNIYISSLEEIQSTKLNDMRLALRNYESFGLSEEYLLHTYIITEWYRQDLYPLVVELGTQIMMTRETYKPAIKLVGHSLFELGKYEESKDILTRFHRLDDSDPGVNYMLGIIYAKTRDSVLANIFLRRALDLGYSPTLNLRRHIAYNFALIESQHNLLKALKDLIEQEEEYEKTDLSLAIYYHILYEAYDTAIELSKLGQEKYSDDAYFYGYEGWAQRELGDPEAAIGVLQNGLKIIPDNPFLYLQLAFALKETGNTESMKIILDTLLALDISPEYRQIAHRERLLLSR